MRATVPRLVLRDIEWSQALLRCLREVSALRHQPIQNLDLSPDAGGMHHGAPLVLLSDDRRIGRHKRLQSIELAKSRRLKGTNGGSLRERKSTVAHWPFSLAHATGVMANLSSSASKVAPSSSNQRTASRRPFSAAK